jgi:putative transposase
VKVAMKLPKNKPLAKETKVKPSNNLVNLNRRIARVKAKIANIRRDFLHKATTRLCRENQTIKIEGLNVKGMTASSKGDACLTRS